LWEATTLNSITIYFETPPATNSVRVSIYAAVSGVAITTDLDSLDDVALSSATPNDYLVYDGTNWVNQQITSLDSLTIENDLTVEGNLTVNGTTTTINTETVNIEDNVIVLNSNAVAPTTAYAGIEVERGSSNNVSLRWNESSSVWEITVDGTNYYAIATSQDISGVAIGALDDIGDVAITSATPNQYLTYDGSDWVNTTLPITTSGASTGQALVWNGTNFIPDTIVVAADTRDFEIKSLMNVE
jgi:hypothetical protein